MSSCLTHNLLTSRLLSEGYSQTNHPDHVIWVSSGYRDGYFEYREDYLRTTFWMTPCGLYRRYRYEDDTSWKGITYSPENNNPLMNCCTPEREADCPYAVRFPFGYQCPIRMVENYDYQNSVERIERERDEILKASLEELVAKHPGAWACACRSSDRMTNKACFHYDPKDCLEYGGHGCLQEKCCITGKPRDTTLANIYYDRRITIDRHKGLLNWTDTYLCKGIRRFSTRKPVAVLEEWLRVYADSILHTENINFHHILYHYAGAMKLTVENIRIEKRESQDILQDIRDTQEGIMVSHDSERIKKMKAEKRSQRQKRIAEGQRRKQEKTVASLLALLEQQDTPREEHEEALRRLHELGVDAELAVRKEQLSLF